MIEFLPSRARKTSGFSMCISRLLTWTTISTTVALSACSARGVVPPPSPSSDFDLSTWLPLSIPQDQSFVGLGWTGTGGVDENCYGMKKQVETLSYDSVYFVWRRDDTTSASLSVAKMFGLSAEGTKAAGVILRLEGVKRAVASGLTPGNANCTNTKKNYPSKPAVEEALGARRLVYVAFNREGKVIKDASVDGSILKKVFKVGVDASRRSSDSTFLSFNGDRWLAVRLTGFQEGKPDSSFTPELSWGSVHTIPLGWAVRVDSSEKTNRYRVNLRKVIGGEGVVDTVLSNGELVDLQGSANAASERTVANFWVMPERKTFKLTLVTLRSERVTFTNADSAKAWSNRR